MVMQTVLMLWMSIKIAQEDLVVSMSSVAATAFVYAAHTGVTGAMTVGTAATS